MVEDKARDRVESLDSARERNAVIRPQGPDAARMDFFNGLLCERAPVQASVEALNVFGAARRPMSAIPRCLPN